MDSEKSGNQDLPEVQKSVLGQEKICSVDGCFSSAKTKGLCCKHYTRMSRSGVTSLRRRENGTGTMVSSGYVGCVIGGKRVFAHTIVAELALGKPLPKGAVVHHVDGDKTNNERSNLVICENSAYHTLLHTRKKAYDATGDVEKRRCNVCGSFDGIENMKKYGRHYVHSECKNRYIKQLRDRKK